MASNEFHTYDPTSKPPAFGHPLKKYWAFDEKYVNLNNGSYGALPLPVYAEAQKLSLLSEKNPDKFMRFDVAPLLRESRQLIAEFVGAGVDEIVLVPNTTHGVNVILRNFEWKEGDVIISASTTYDAVTRTIAYIGDRSEQPRPSVRTVQYTFPMSTTEIIDSFKALIREAKQAHPASNFTDVPPRDGAVVDGGAKGNKIVAVIDSLTSNPGVLLPWKEIVRVCEEEGVWSIIDAAHSLGQEAVDLGKSKPDFWVSNCHKWLYVKRGCAALYVPKRNQHIIKSSIPTSHGYVRPSDPQYGTVGTNFVGQHDWTGTMDFSPALSIKYALAFRKWLGGEEVINKYCRNLAVSGGKKLAEILGTKVMDETGELTLNMSNILLPLPIDIPGSKSQYTPELLQKIDAAFRQKLLLEWNTYVAHFFYGGAWWVRTSAQVWNEESDFEYVGKALKTIVKEIQADILHL